ncbi:type III ribulose-bisphosphate carboxylase [archaeon]|nr:type III ribulose-bisphosphate carboxylase [archaeon]
MDYINLKYKPKKEDLVCLFRIEPVKGISMKGAASRVAGESSVGTWAKLYNLPKRIKRIKPKVFEIKKNHVKIAYPVDLFEKGNMSQIMSGIGGNIFGMKALRNLRLEDVKWPLEIMKSFKGPQFGVKGLRKLLKVKKRPLTATVIKPKVGLDTKEYCKSGRLIWESGMDFLKNDENMTSQKFINFYKTTKKVLKIRDSIEKETGEKKMYLANVSSETKEMLKRAKFVKDNGGEIVMVDILTVGFSGLQTLRNECKDLGLAIYGHRAFHSTFTRNVKHGISMMVVADLARLIGVDAVHIGGMGKLISPKEELYLLKEELEKKDVKKGKNVLGENWGGIKPTFPVTSGGLHAGIIPRLIKLLGTDILMQVGGGVMGHKDGIVSGGRSVRQAIDATLQGISLNEYKKEHPELRSALELWGNKTPI